MNACSSCKRGKRKCDKVRPSCSNCLRLRRDCVYTEDNVQTHFDSNPGGRRRQRSFQSDSLRVAISLNGIDLFSHGTLQQHSMVDIAMRIIGSHEDMLAVSNQFFITTHQRLPALSKFRFYENLQYLTAGPGPRPDFTTLCLSILLIQQMPSEWKTNDVQSPLYIMVKTFINMLEMSGNLSIDLAHSRVLVAFYEIGHGLHTAAYISVAACARTARALGLHPRMKRKIDDDIGGFGTLALEEGKRTWWAIANMDRFIGLCDGDALLATDDPGRKDPLPIEDLLWSESSSAADMEGFIAAPPSLDTPFNTTVGQMARECQISYLAGRVARHVFDPVGDRDFNENEGLQLERTLKAYLPLLANEELKIGKYCGAFGVCNNALFILYEFMLGHIPEDDTIERDRILQSVEVTSLRAIEFAEAAYNDRAENYPRETISPYLTYSLYQAAVIQFRLWKQSGGSPAHKRNLDSVKAVLGEFAHRWMVTWQYLEILENANETWPPLVIPFLGVFVGTGKSRTVF